MLYTDKQYYMDEKYVGKLDLMVKRMQGTDDNILLIDGDEGQGKTELTMCTCYYIAYKTGRKYNINHIFFDLDEGIKFAAETKDQIIHFDEGALGLLTTQWWNKNQQKFLQLVMIARKKRHFMAICIPKFYKLNQYIVEERSIGLVHVYSHKNIKKGRFCYYTKDAKEKLYQDWKRKKVKTYRKHYKLRGTFVQASKRVFTEEERDHYEAKKDQAILSLTSPETKNKALTEKEMKIKLVKQFRDSMPELTLKQIGKGFCVSERTINNYLATKNIETPMEIPTKT